MSLEAVQQVIGRAATDAEFRTKLLADTRATCKDYDLSEDELAALEALDANGLETFAGSLDIRITKSGGRGFI